MITTYEQLERLIKECTTGLELKELLGRVDDNIIWGNLKLEDEHFHKLSDLVNKVKDTYK